MNTSLPPPNSTSGTLYGIGVGPGDPELITLKALRLLRSVGVVAYPAPLEGESLARKIVAAHLDHAPVEVPIRMPMVAARFPAQEVYDKAVETLSQHLENGSDVAVLCEGDPFFYGSFMFLFGRIATLHKVEVVPGVSSLTACASALGAPLASRNDVLTIIPATLEAKEIGARLEASDAAVIIKVGRHLNKIREVLSKVGLASKARYIQHATMPHQLVVPFEDLGNHEAPYFSMILVHRRDVAWKI